MELVRLGTASTRNQESSVHRAKDDLEVWVLFRKIGLGSMNSSDFRVAFAWNDIDKLITEFATMKHPKAMELVNARSLAISARRAGWGPKSP